MALPWQGATPPRWARLNLHRERERTKGTNRPHICISTTGTDTTTATGEDGRNGQQSRRPSSRPRTARRPRAHPPPAAPAEQHQHGHRRQQTRTDHGRTTAPREGRQTDTEHREGPPQLLDPVKHLDSIGRARERATETMGNADSGRRSAAPAILPSRKRKTGDRRTPGRMKNGNRNKPRSFQRMKRERKEKQESTWTHGRICKPFSPKRKKPEGSERSNATFGLFERITLYTE